MRAFPVVLGGGHLEDFQPCFSEPGVQWRPFLQHGSSNVLARRVAAGK